MKPIHAQPVAPRFTTAVRFQARGGASCLNCGAPFTGSHQCVTPVTAPPPSPGLEYLRLRGIVQTSAKDRP
jgi:hypothetical protein